MKIINWFINKYATPSLLIGSIAIALMAGILLLAVVFNFNPYISLKSGNMFGFVSYAKGIPVKMSFSNSIPDTSISYEKISENESGSESGRIYIDNTIPKAPDSESNWKTVYADTITTKYKITGYSSKEKKQFNVSGFSFDGATAYVKTSKTLYRLIFMFPTLLALFLMSYCSWQLGRLLDYIQAGEIFEWINFTRLQNIGLAIIFFQLFCLLISIVIMITGNSWSMYVEFNSSIPHFREPAQINAQPEYGFEWYSLIIGCIIVAIAKAFKKGYTLQKEQDLII